MHRERSPDGGWLALNWNVGTMIDLDKIMVPGGYPVSADEIREEIKRLRKESRTYLMMADQRQAKYCDAMKQVNELRTERDELRTQLDMWRERLTE